MKPLLTTTLGAVLLALALCATAATPFKIVTASQRGTYIRIGQDLARFVAPDADIDLEVLPSAGSTENVRRLRSEPGVKFALVQSDVYQAYVDQADEGDRRAGELIRPLRMIMPLYNEEIYFLARSDAPFDAIHEIRGQRINAGPIGSGTALTAATLYRQMFGEALPERTTFFSNEEALAKLVDDRSLDVVIVVAGQPAPLLAQMQPEARRLVKLLRLEPSHATSRAALRTYFPANVSAASYPNLLDRDLPGLAVKAFLVTYDYQTEHTRARLGAFARSLCRNFPRLQAEGHPKWKEVALGQPPIGRGWRYSSQTGRELQACTEQRGAAQPPPAAPTPAATAQCTQQQRILALCK